MVEYKTFASKDFSGKKLAAKSFTNCCFENCNFTESIWRNIHFASCTFTRCNLSLVKLEGSRLHDVVFVDCKIVGAEFFKCDKVFFSIEAKGSFFQYCNFSDRNMKSTSFGGSKCKECHFTNTNLVQADFQGVDLLGTVFHGCDLSKADFRTATNYIIDPRNNRVAKAKFSFPEVVRLLDGFEIVVD